MWKQCPQRDSRFRDASGRCPMDGVALVELADPMLGRVIAERYELVEHLGAGGMGTVYRARHVVLGRDVAVKVLMPRFSEDESLRARFLGEAAATNLLRHPNIVDIHDCGIDGKHLFLVMELLSGEAVEARIARGAIAPVEALDIAIDVARALGRAHALGVVHRDIKPGNIFLSSHAPRVKVLDFGIARMPRATKLTETGQVFGTPEYMAPEQTMAEECTAATDIYSLGVTLFEMLTRRLPFEGTVAQLVVHHVRTPPRSLREIDPALPEELEAAVAKMLRKTPATRQSDADGLIAELEALRADLFQKIERPVGEPLAPTTARSVAATLAYEDTRGRTWP